MAFFTFPLDFDFDLDLDFDLDGVLWDFSDLFAANATPFGGNFFLIAPYLRVESLSLF